MLRVFVHKKTTNTPASHYLTLLIATEIEIPPQKDESMCQQKSPDCSVQNRMECCS